MQEVATLCCSRNDGNKILYPSSEQVQGCPRTCSLSLVGAAHVWPTGQEGCLHVQQTLAEATGLQKLSQKGSFQECLFYSHTRFPALDSLKNRGAQVGDMHTVQSVPLSMTLKLFQSRKLVS
jgi:hypothetical protein